jgi:putative transposase
MPRRQRLDFPGAFFHVTCRGNRKQPIFLSDDDRYYFLSCLREAHEKYAILIHVYCLMENHYHLLLETLRAGLSKAMHLINMKYSNYFNLKHDRCGHLFQSRFKAILVEAAVYARELASYIHLNPVRAGIVKRPEDYIWSNYRAYVGQASPQGWSSSSFVLGLFGSSKLVARTNYETFVRSRLDHNCPDPLKSAEHRGILGGHEFIEKVRRLSPPDDSVLLEEDPEACRTNHRRASLENILAETEALLGPKSGITRKLAIYISHAKTDRSLKEIGAFFGIGNSGISDICRRLRKELAYNETLGRLIKEIEYRLYR